MKIKLSIDRFEGDKVVLLSDNSENIIWLKKDLPENVKEGSILIFEVFTEDEETKEKENLAKNILNEILENND